MSNGADYIEMDVVSRSTRTHVPHNICRGAKTVQGIAIAIAIAMAMPPMLASTAEEQRCGRLAGQHKRWRFAPEAQSDPGRQHHHC